MSGGGRCQFELPGGMFSPGSFKDGGLIALFFEPQGKDHPDPHIGQGAHSNRVAFPFLAFAVIVVLRPRFLLGTLPGELVERVAQRLDTGKPLMNGGVVAADPVNVVLAHAVIGQWITRHLSTTRTAGPT